MCTQPATFTPAGNALSACNSPQQKRTPCYTPPCQSTPSELATPVSHSPHLLAEPAYDCMRRAHWPQMTPLAGYAVMGPIPRALPLSHSLSHRLTCGQPVGLITLQYHQPPKECARGCSLPCFHTDIHTGVHILKCIYMHTNARAPTLPLTHPCTLACAQHTYAHAHPHAPAPYRMAIIWVSPHGSNIDGTTIMSAAA